MREGDSKNQDLFDDSVEKYQTLVNSIDQGFCIIEMIFDSANKPINYIFKEVNPVFESQSGLRNAIGKTILDLVPDLESRWFEIYGEILLTGKSRRFLEGSEAMGRWFEVYAFKIGDKSSNKIAILFSDVTQKKKVEDALKDSEDSLRQKDEHLRALFTATTDIIYYMNADWSVMGALQGRIFVSDIGTTSPDWFENNIPTMDQQLVRDAINEAIATKSIFQLEHRVNRADNTIGWTHSRAIPILNSNGEISEWIGAAGDISDRKKFEEEISLNNIQLKRTNIDLDNFIYTASHDLKAPIANIEGLLIALKENLQLDNLNASKEVEELFKLIDNSVHHFKTTISDLTEISKVQKGENEDIVKIRWADLLNQLKHSIEIGPEIFIEADFTEVKTIKFSKKNLQSVLYNLLSNAIKYRDTNRLSKIQIKTYTFENFTVLEFKDNGLGINQQNLGKVFSMFKRFHNHVEGSGIGLYIVKRIMDNAGGKIEVESEVGQGTTFKIYFLN